MLELVEYATHTIKAPGGESIPPLCRLLLLIIISEGKGELVEINRAKVCNLLGSIHPKSLSRLLKNLTNLRLLSLEQGRAEKGTWAAILAFPLPLIRRSPGNPTVTPSPEIDAPGNSTVTRLALPGNPAVTPSQPGNSTVTRLNPNEINGLQSPGNPTVTPSNGMEIALKSPPLIFHNTEKEKEGSVVFSVEGGLRNDAVRVWQDVFNETITAAGIQLISSKVTHMEPWKDTLEAWKASGWLAKNIGGQIERYEKKLRDYVIPATPLTDSEIQKKEAIRRRIYGLDENE